jgi:hypothetical protein
MKKGGKFKNMAEPEKVTYGRRWRSRAEGGGRSRRLGVNSRRVLSYLYFFVRGYRYHGLKHRSPQSVCSARTHFIIHQQGKT